MENSFFEYRDELPDDADSDSEVIDDSVTEDVTYSSKKKNGTVFVAESEESEFSGDEAAQHTSTGLSKDAIAATKHNRISEALVISSSEDGGSRRGSIRTSVSQNNVIVSSSSDEEELSPELLPKRRPPLQQKSPDANESLILKRTKKRLFFAESDTDNSIIVEHKKQQKQVCRQKTPLKIANGNRNTENLSQSMDYDNESCDGDDDDDSEDDASEVSEDDDQNDIEKTNIDDNASLDDSKTLDTTGKETTEIVADEDGDNKNCSKNDSERNDNHITSGDNNVTSDESDRLDEDMMVMSRATRMSIMGVIPKDNESDDSDYIQSDSSSRRSAKEISNSIEDLPEVTINKTPNGSYNSDKDSSRISCSPFSSPLQDITNKQCNKSNSNNEPHKSTKASPKQRVTEYLDLTTHSPIKAKSVTGVVDLSEIEPKRVDNKVLNRSASVLTKKHYDDDVTIIDTKPEIIALSSDDEDEVNNEKKSPRTSKSPKVTTKKSSNEEQLGSKMDIKQYLLPPSYPNQVVYVKKHVRENELNKLARLQEDVNNIRRVLENTDMESLPDGGVKLVERLSALEAETRRHADKVANMVVEPDNPSASDIAKDGFDKGLSWDELQKASNAVQPRMFGKQAMATHMAERSVTLDSLRELHQSLSSRPEETVTAPPPKLIKSDMMPHQLHALAWLKWRETQKPCGGILADDMGLGKTITMIALVASDKEARIDHYDDDDEAAGRGKLVRGGTLVVCPASLIQQWANEVGKHCTPHALSVCLHHGAARAAVPHRLATYDIVATTYNILQRDNEKNGVLMRVQWRRVILDEAHIVRNHKSATSGAVCALKGKRRWCLTGTPVQNKDLDLFALIKFLRCFPFDDLQMWKKWIDNKSLGGQERMSTMMGCLLLRRTKAQLQGKGQLACLPSKEKHLTAVTLTREEMNVYQKVLVLSKNLFAQFLHQRAEKNSDSTSFTSKGKDSEYAKMHKKMIALHGVKPVKSHEILVLLLRLRQVCCHCGLIAGMLDDSAQDTEGPSDDLLRELDKMTLEDQDRRKSTNQEQENEEPQEETSADQAIRSVLTPNNPVFKLERLSSKISAVMDCLNNQVFKNKGDKAVVVSQWTSVLSLVKTELDKRGVRSVTLSGAVPVPARPALIAALNDANTDVRVMLLSLCAGGVGINLCGANHLLLLDPHWNPQLEEQAQDRIYRVGQTRPVHIYRFMCVDTVEQKIRKLQEDKLQLAENVLTGAKNNAVSTLSIEDLKMLFNMGG